MSGFWSKWKNSFLALHLCLFNPLTNDLYVDWVGIFIKNSLHESWYYFVLQPWVNGLNDLPIQITERKWDTNECSMVKDPYYLFDCYCSFFEDVNDVSGFDYTSTAFTFFLFRSTNGRFELIFKGWILDWEEFFWWTERIEALIRLW